uniref:Uncharacterized protein n=1 Tax=Anguilla anguilla TaxID=7936 RepID=A0A0E9X5I6_ANGAN
MSQRVVQGYILTFLQIRYFSRCMGVRTTHQLYLTLVQKGEGTNLQGPGASQVCVRNAVTLYNTHTNSLSIIFTWNIQYATKYQVKAQQMVGAKLQSSGGSVSPRFHDFLSYSSQLKPSERGVRTVQSIRGLKGSLAPKHIKVQRTQWLPGLDSDTFVRHRPFTSTDNLKTFNNCLKNSMFVIYK